MDGAGSEQPMREQMEKKARRISKWVGSLLVAALLATGGCDRASTVGGDEVERARAALQKGGYATAIIHLKNAIQRKPDRLDAHLELARIYDRLGDGPALRKQVDRLRELGAEGVEIALLEARALLGEREYGKIGEIEVPEAGDPEMLARLHVVRARAAFAEGRREIGMKAFDRALLLSPEAAPVLEMQARLAFHDGHSDEAARQVERALERYPANPDLLDLRGQIALAGRRFQEAAESYQAILDLPGAEQARYGLNARFYLVLTWIGAGEYDKALPEIERMLARSPRHPMPNYLMGLYAYRQGDFERAESHLLEVIKKGLDFRPALLLLGAVDFAMGNYEQAEMYLSSYIARKPENDAARKLLGITHLKLEDPHGALSVLDPLVEQKEGGNAGLLSLVGEIAIRAGDVKRAREYFRRALEAGAAGEVIDRRLAETYLLEGDLDRARALLGEGLEETGADRRSTVLFVMGLIQKGETAEAERVARELRSRNPDSAFADNLLAGVLLMQRKFDEAEALLNAALEKEPQFVPAMLNLARVDEIRDRPENAVARYLRILEVDPDNTRAMVRLARLKARGGARDQALELLERARRVNRSDFEARVMLAGLLLAGKRLEEAMQVAREARDLRPGHPAAAALVGRILYRQGRYEEAVEPLERWREGRPNHAAARLALAEVLIKLDRRKEAVGELHAALELSPDSLAVIRTLATAEISWGNEREAVRLVEDLRRRHPKSPAVQRVEGDVLWLAGRYREAAEAYRRALQLEPHTLMAIRTAKALSKGGDLPGARSELEKWLEFHPDDTAARVELGNLLHRMGDLAGAVREYEAANALRPDSPMVLNNLALAYFEQGDDKAVEVAERAYRLASENPAVADTRGWILLHHGDVFQALELIRQAAERLPGVAEIRYHLASALARAGQKGQALRVIEDALGASGPDVPWRAEAEALRASLQEG